jgi:hypothetical protein
MAAWRAWASDEHRPRERAVSSPIPHHARVPRRPARGARDHRARAQPVSAARVRARTSTGTGGAATTGCGRCCATSRPEGWPTPAWLTRCRGSALARGDDPTVPDQTRHRPGSRRVRSRRTDRRPRLRGSAAAHMVGIARGRSCATATRRSRLASWRDRCRRQGSSPRSAAATAHVGDAIVADLNHRGRRPGEPHVFPRSTRRSGRSTRVG